MKKVKVNTTADATAKIITGTYLMLRATKDGYGIDQVGNTITAGELISFLENYDEDTKIYLCFDNGYTYGAIKESRFCDEDSVEETEYDFS